MKVTRTRNRAETKGESIEYRVTNAPAIPTFASDVYDGIEIISVDDLLTGTKSLKVEWNENIESDEFYVTWYLYRGDKQMKDLEIATYKLANVFTSEFNPTDAIYASKFEESGEDIEGFYYALVKNKLNGVESAYNESEKPKQDKIFNVTGS
jgi:hypothetical protein